MARGGGDKSHEINLFNPRKTSVIAESQGGMSPIGFDFALMNKVLGKRGINTPDSSTSSRKSETN